MIPDDGIDRRGLVPFNWFLHTCDGCGARIRRHRQSTLKRDNNDRVAFPIRWFGTQGNMRCNQMEGKVDGQEGRPRINSSDVYHTPERMS